MTANPAADRPHFLLATDLDPELLPQLAMAARLADSFGAHVTLFHAIPPPAPIYHGAPLAATQPEAISEAVVRERLRSLAAAVQVGRPLHLRLTTAMDPATAVLQAAGEVHATAIAMPTRARTGLGRLVLGSIAETVLRRAHHPVAMITETMVRRAPRPGVRRRVLFTTDMTPAAEAALPTAARLAVRLQLPLRLLTVVTPFEAPGDGGVRMPLSVAAREQQRETFLAGLRRLTATLPNELEVDLAIEESAEVAPAICAAAEAADAAFVVMATHGRKGIARLLLGSVTETVVHRSAVPVVCVPQLG